MKSPFQGTKGNQNVRPSSWRPRTSDRENNRYGMVRNLISVQDEINKRRSKALHLLSVRQVIAVKTARSPTSTRRGGKWRSRMGYISINPGMKFEIQEGGELCGAGWPVQAVGTRDGRNAGRRGRERGDERHRSARVVGWLGYPRAAGGRCNARRTSQIADTLRMRSRTVYEIAWMAAARQRSTAGRFVHVTDDLGTTVKYVGINQPVRSMDELADACR